MILARTVTRKMGRQIAPQAMAGVKPYQNPNSDSANSSIPQVTIRHKRDNANVASVKWKVVTLRSRETDLFMADSPHNGLNKEQFN